MSNFGKAKKYYTKSEVEKQVKTLLSESELKISKQNNLILALNSKLEKREKELKELVKREKLIKNALIHATESSKIAYDDAKLKRKHEIVRLEEFLQNLTVQKNENKQIKAANIEELKQIISDFKAGAGAGELARRRELEAARQKLDEVNKETKEAQKSIDERYRAVLEKYETLKGKEQSAEVFSIEEALNPTASLEEIMKDIFKKK